LESLIKSYQTKGYQFVSINDVLRHIEGEYLHEKFVCITLDDGYYDNYEIAYPIFKKYHVPFCIYIATTYVDGDFTPRSDSPRALTTESLLQLSLDPLCTIGAHTASHVDLSQLNTDEQKREIEDSVNLLGKLLGKKIVHFSTPYGAYDEQTLELLKSAGIQSNTFAWGGPLRVGDKYDKYLIPRIIIEEDKKTN